MVLNNSHYIFVIKTKGHYDERTHIYSDMQKVLQEFSRQHYNKRTQVCKTFTKFETKSIYPWIYLIIFSRWHCNNQRVGVPPPEVSYKVPLQVPRGNCSCHQLHVSWCPWVNWQPIEPPKPLGNWSRPLHIVSCFFGVGLRVRGWLQIAPKELQLPFLHWTSCQLHGAA